MKNFNKKLLLIFLVVIITGCNKYDDGPAFSLRSKKGRVAGEWVVTEYIYDNINFLSLDDQTQQITCQNGNTLTYKSGDYYSDLFWTFDKDGGWEREMTSISQFINPDSSYETCSAIYIEERDHSSESGKWQFGAGKESILISDGFYSESWQIIELREKRMKLKMAGVFGDDAIVVLEKK